MDRSRLINEVTIVHHFAASVRMDLPLRDAVAQNVIGTKAMLELCREMKKLKVSIKIIYLINMQLNKV